ncbi:MAG: hypothetical protein IJ371_02225 [Clostridia bacterium]|nr:hypothetical protein [Clostridia bacterium]
MKIVVDAFGGDYAPHEIVLGCIEAVKRNPEVNLVLAGDKDQLEKELFKIFTLVTVLKLFTHQILYPIMTIQQWLLKISLVHQS